MKPGKADLLQVSSTQFYSDFMTFKQVELTASMTSGKFPNIKKGTQNSLAAF